MPPEPPGASVKATFPPWEFWSPSLWGRWDSELFSYLIWFLQCRRDFCDHPVPGKCRRDHAALLYCLQHNTPNLAAARVYRLGFSAPGPAGHLWPRLSGGCSPAVPGAAVSSEGCDLQATCGLPSLGRQRSVGMTGTWGGQTSLLVPWHVPYEGTLWGFRPLTRCQLGGFA